jgi:hypothetical protein
MLVRGVRKDKSVGNEMGFLYRDRRGWCVTTYNLQAHVLARSRGETLGNFYIFVFGQLCMV